MEMVKIEQVIVGSEISTEIKSEPVVTSLQSYLHESLQCFQCFIIFPDSKARERHMKTSHRDQYQKKLQQANTRFACYKCDKYFFSPDELRQHQSTHNAEEKSFRCSYCRMRFSTFTELNKHRRNECIKRLCPCRDCDALFPNPSRLRTHRNIVHPQSPVVADDGSDLQTEKDLWQHQEKNCVTTMECKKRGRKPNGAQGGTVDSKKIKQEEEVVGYKGYETPAEGCNSNELHPELKIPCPEADCDLIFPSVSALRAHKREQHGLPPRKTRA